MLMAIPDFQSLMHPLLEAHNDGKEHKNRDLVNALADQFNYSIGVASASNYEVKRIDTDYFADV